MMICMWSGPRNLSTAMMRSFGARSDCNVLDEPFFAPYLKVSGKDHPGRKETLAEHETDPLKVAELCVSQTAKPYSFQKHMPHHMLPEFPTDWMRTATHFFLLRHPRRVISSYAKGRAAFGSDDLCFAAQRQLWAQLDRPPVIHSEAILKDPETALTKLCAALQIPYISAMLSWPAGPHPADGAWAPWWYQSVWNSTGFGPAPTDMPAVAPEHQLLLDACLSDYEALAAHAIEV